MGVVYQAYDRKRKAVVALKTLRQGDPAAIYRFKSEFRSLADINHPNLVTLHELVSLRDQWFFTMELIDGVNFLTYMRGDEGGGDFDTLKAPLPADQISLDGHPPRHPATPPEDFERLRQATRQLAEGVHALHEAGKLHRDIKPSNVLITRFGRVVLLDFGLVADLEAIDTPSSTRLLVGTAVYMAPEQAASQSLTAASDWYSVGVILYEALTGLVPFDGPPLAVVMRKQKELPARPRELLPEIPEDLDELCTALLEIDPRKRPSGLAVLRRLGSQAGAERRTRTTLRSRSDDFIGRQKHLAQLESAFAETLAGQLVTVFIHGRSGMGKTALLERFLRELSGERAVVLEGRCYEREYVPYKALDALIDSLIHFLSRRNRDHPEAISPQDAAAIARLFPVFRRIGNPAEKPRLRDAGDPQEMRRRGMMALRALLHRIAEGEPLVLSIDNLQWSDSDSVSLLIDLIRPPDPPPLLLLVCYRSEEATASSAIRLFLRSLRTAGITRRELVVGALGTDETRLLVHSKLGEASAEAEVFGESLISESAGNPYFVDELVRYIQFGASPVDDRTSVSLEDAIMARVSQLPDEPRSVLELVAVAGRPMEQAIVAAAADLGVKFASALALLRAGYLIRTRGTSDLDRIEAYHDRIRETIVANLPDERTRTIHARLALALEASGRATPEALVFHFQEAGDDERAGDHAIRAAANAAEALAFERAAELYKMAIECLPESVVTDRHLRVALGDALANAGLGAQAAQQYQLAATGASAAFALELERRAAEQKLLAGYVDEGLDSLRAVLGALGIRMASSPRRAMASILSQHARQRLRGFRFTERDTSQIAPEELTRIDVCWSAATTVGVIDPIHGADFQARHLRLSLDAGEPYRVARAFALEAIYSAIIGVSAWKRTQKLIALAEDTAGRIEVPHADALAIMARAWAEYYAGHYQRALYYLVQTSTLLREECTGVAFEMAAVDRLTSDALYYLGEVDRLRDHVRSKLREAERRGDRYGATTMRIGLHNAIWLADDDPERARQEADRAMETWSRNGFHWQHYFHGTALARAELYAGEPALARDVMTTMWPHLERGLLLRIHALRTEAVFLRGRAAVAARDVDDAVHMAKKLSKEKVPAAAAQAAVLQAGLARLRGERARAIAHLERAAAVFAAADMTLLAAACRSLWGRITGGTAGDERARQADQWMRRRSIREPVRFATMLVGAGETEDR